MARTYRNPWIPDEALKVLEAHGGTILDVGGGASPYAGATHVVDMQPFSAERLRANAWPPGRTPVAWTDRDYTRCDIVASARWPFETGQFDLGLSSHCLEDLRDPLPAVREICRVCRKVALIFPSRLIEQTRGIEHPRFCGFPHHPWIVFAQGGRLVFRRKTPVLELPAAHLTCPSGKTLRVGDGCWFLAAESVEPEEQVFWSAQDDLEDYARFIAPCRSRRDLFVPDGLRHGLRFRIWKLRQRIFGVL